MSKRVTIEDCQRYAENNGGQCLSKEYISAHTKMEWKCRFGHSWFAGPGSIRNNKNWCPYCSGNAKLTLKSCQKFAKDKRGKCLSEKYTNNKQKLDWVCSEGHTWKSCFSHIKNNNRWCPKCGGTAKLSLKDCQEFVKNKGGQCLSKKYKNAQTKMEWKCVIGHKWNTNFNHIKNGNWCPKCCLNKSQKELLNIIKEIFPNKIVEINYRKFAWLKTVTKHK